MKHARRAVIDSIGVLAIAGALLTVGCGGGQGPEERASDAGPRSVVVVVVDGLRADHIASYGGSLATPSFDTLAAQSIRFDWCFAQAPDPAVSFASMLTGLYPTTSGVVSPGDRLPEEASTLAEVLAAAGFETAAFIEGAADADDLGLGQGFGIYAASVDPGAAARQWIVEHSTDRFLVVLRGWSVGLDFGPGTAIDGVEPPAGFFDRLQMVLASRGTGQPQALEGADLEYAKLLYEDRIRAADQALGELMAKLEDLGVADSAILVVTGSTGLDLGQHGASGGQSLHSTVTRVPLFVRVPAVGKPQAIDKIVELIDLAPTLAELAGVEVPAGVQGASLLPIVDGAGRPPYIAFAESPWLGSQRAVALGGLRLMTSLDGEPALYDLTADPDELVDVAADHADKVEVLERHLEAWGKMVSAASLDPELRTEGELDDATLEQLKSLGYIQ
jgi:arylsulfatase A-like enzyme